MRLPRTPFELLCTLLMLMLLGVGITMWALSPSPIEVPPPPQLPSPPKESTTDVEKAPLSPPVVNRDLPPYREPPTAILGRVLDPQTGRGIASADVIFQSTLDSERKKMVSTRADGRFAIDLGSSEYGSVILRAEGYIPQRLKAGSGDFVRVPMVKGLSLHGRVVTELSGEAILGAIIRAGNDLDAPQCRSGYDGLFELSGLSAGEVEATVVAMGFVPVHFEEHASSTSRSTPREIRMKRADLIAGQIVGGPKGTLVPNARVTCRWSITPLFEKEVLADEQGQFFLGALAHGEESGVQLIVDAENYIRRVLTLNQLPRPWENLRIRLQPGHRLRGQVVDGNGRPVHGARIRFRGGRLTDEGVLTGKNGRWTHRGIRRGQTLTAHVTHPDFPALRVGPYTRKDYIKFASMILWEGARLEGTLRNEQDQPLEGSRVWLQRGNNTLVATKKTDRHGRFVWTNLAAGTYRIRADVAGHYVPEVSSELTLGRTRRVALRGSAGSGVRGIVLDRGSRPIPDVQISLRSQGEYRPLQESRTDTEGRFVITGLPPNRELDLRAEKAGWSSVAQRVTSDDPELTLTMRPPHGFRGRAIDERSGSPLQAFRVDVHQLRPKSRSPYRSTIDIRESDGRFDIAALPPGVYRTRVRAPGYLSTPWRRITPVIRSQRTEVVFSLAASGSIRLQVRDSKGGSLPHLPVYVQAVDPNTPGRLHHQSSTDPNGHVTFADLVPGSWDVGVGFPSAPYGEGALVSVVAGREVEHTLTSRPLAYLEVHVSSDQPWDLTLTHLDSNWNHTRRASRNEPAAFESLIPGDYLLEAWDDQGNELLPQTSLFLGEGTRERRDY